MFSFPGENTFNFYLISKWRERKCNKGGTWCNQFVGQGSNDWLIPNPHAVRAAYSHPSSLFVTMTSSQLSTHWGSTMDEVLAIKGKLFLFSTHHSKPEAEFLFLIFTFSSENFTQIIWMWLTSLNNVNNDKMVMLDRTVSLVCP